MRAHPLLLLSLTAAFGCRYQPVPVPTIGSDHDLGRLTGTWYGQYAGHDSRRLGIIEFTVAADPDSTTGHVMITEDGIERQYLRSEDRRLARPDRDSPARIPIAFIQVRGDAVRGELEPYLAPDCRCLAVTRFIGRVRGDSAVGRFTTRREWGPDQSGEWSASRAAVP